MSVCAIEFLNWSLLYNKLSLLPGEREAKGCINQLSLISHFQFINATSQDLHPIPASGSCHLPVQASLENPASMSISLPKDRYGSWHRAQGSKCTGSQQE